MNTLRKERAQSPSATRQLQNRALHEYMLNPFRSCMSSGDEGDHSTFPSMQDASSLGTPPGSQAPTVVGSVSDRSVDSDIMESENGKPSKCYEEIPSSVDQQSESFISEASLGSESEDLDFDSQPLSSFFLFRMSYLFVTLVVMLADGLQGTHLYVLYEGYGFSVASLYCLGFFTGAVTAPITGPMIDRFGRKKMALLYCALEVGINSLEQFPFLSGLIVSRMVGGITTNLLSTVFEAWADTEYRKRGFSANQYETLMRDSVVVSNLAAIASGYLAHVLAEAMGPKGPFEGAVTCTALAFGVVFFLWTENYGSSRSTKASVANAFLELKDTVNDIRADSRILRVCITQGLTMGSLHIFIFLWSPVLKDYAMSVQGDQLGLDAHGEPAYGLIFGAFMAAGVVGGLCSPSVRKMVTLILSPLTKSTVPEVVTVDGEGEVRPMAVEFQAATCYILCAILLFVPVVLKVSDPSSFGIALFSFFCYEILVGIYFPCEGVIRSLYMPPGTRGSMMTIPRIIVNLAVAFGVISTELISRQTAMGIISLLMLVSGCLQLTLISTREWQSLFGRIEEAKRKSLVPFHSFSSSMIDFVSSPMSTRETGDKTSTAALVDQVPLPNLLNSRPKTE